MSSVIEIAAEAERPARGASADLALRRGEEEQSSLEDLSENLPEHQFPETGRGRRRSSHRHGTRGRQRRRIANGRGEPIGDGQWRCCGAI